MISGFKGRYRFLSNFYLTPVWYGGRVYPSSEHAFQAAKFTDKKSKRLIEKAETPGEAKRLGNSMLCRGDWDEIRIDVMEEVLRAKFSNPVLKNALVQTAPHKLIEGNTHGDDFWGVATMKGKNHLGKLLMKLRDEFQNSPE